MHPPDAPGSIIPTCAPDEETRAVAEDLETAEATTNACILKSSSLSTPPDKANYFEGEGLM